MERETSSTPTLTGIALNGLRFAPPEVREMIFKEMFSKRLTHVISKLPAPLKALQSDPLLYQEALAIYAKITPFKIHWLGDWQDRRIRILNGEELIPPKVIQELGIYFFGYWESTTTFFAKDQLFEGNLRKYLKSVKIGKYNWPKYYLRLNYFVGPKQYFRDMISQATNITELNLLFNSCDELYDSHKNYHRVFREFTECLVLVGPKLKRFTVFNNKLFSQTQAYPEFICFINEGLGFRGKLESGIEFRSSLFVWEAEEGEFLEWSTRRHATSTLGWGLAKFWRDMEAVTEGSQNMEVVKV